MARRTTVRAVLSALVVVGAPAACGDSGSGTTETTTTGGAEVRPGCECVVVENDQSQPRPTIPECVPDVCDSVQAFTPESGGGSSTGGTGGGPSLEIEDIAALECALAALRDRTPGFLFWSSSTGGGFGSSSGYILIKEDGRAIRRSWSSLDLSAEIDDAILGDLPPADHFQDCLDLSDDEERFACLRSVSLSGETSVCDEGWLYSSY